MTTFLHSIMAIPETYDFVTEVMIPSVDLSLLPSDIDYEMHILGQDYDQTMVDAIDLLSEYHDYKISVTPIDRTVYENDESKRTRFHMRAKSFKSGYDFYLFTDDDFKFVPESFSHYAESIRYLRANPDCALVQSAGFMGARGHEPKPHCRLLWTNLGVTLRNLERDLPEHYTNGIIWKEPLRWKTTYGDDMQICYSPIEHGYYTAKHYRCRTRHYDVPSDLTPEELANRRKIPSEYRHYFAWKLNRGKATSGLEKLSDLDRDGDGEDLIWQRKIFDIIDRDTFTHDNMMELAVPCEKYLKEVYEPAAMKRFGRAPLMDCV